MPWRNSVMDDKVRFIKQLLDGEQMSKVCRDFNISRKTGYKFWNRYKESGHITSPTSKPLRLANQLPDQTEALILRLKKQRPHWGARKIREVFRRKYSDFKLPATSTFHAVFARHSLVQVRKKRTRYKAHGTKLSFGLSANDLWCADYKGEFMVNGKYCYPLTITDDKTRFILCCEALTTTKEGLAFEVFKRVFKRYGLPKAIRTDNGVPFASSSILGLSKLSVWWLRLGIEIERIKPGHPEQNGRHERMHLTLKRETTRPSGSNFLQQQEKFDKFIQEFNYERPHEALGMKTPSEVYCVSERSYKGELPVWGYPGHDLVLRVTHGGRICLNNTKVHISSALIDQYVGLKEVEDGIWLVSFMDYDLGYFDLENKKLTILENPLGKKV